MSKQYLKIKNVSGKPVNFVLPLPNSGSKGVLLNAGECIIAESYYTRGALLKTATFGIQQRRGLIDVEENFNNDLYKIDTNKNLNSELVEEKINIADSEKNAEDYMKS